MTNPPIQPDERDESKITMPYEREPYTLEDDYPDYDDDDPDDYDYDDYGRGYGSYSAGYHNGMNDGFAHGLRYNSIAGRWGRLTWPIERRIPYKVKNFVWRMRKRFQPGYDGIPF